ncbi:antiterminator LoaP [Alkaliphilus peptidifermentans]|uniref:Transcription termination/antitermination protein NusG n=1 Tax=Alkaliphilus peptidifermentans DSM 18978 TaxID=1120976 RepID=A0A1G5I219_9FIRM|nr:antiterminator LoaP [Alkaliphilus peptidifermentans]SCY70097.1 transcriptional antiterminator NusG [Alkaliphilus peptidifermentans DSM 18978]
MSWYAIFVKTGEEDVVGQYIHYHFHQSEYNLIIPKKKMNERREGKLYSVVKTLFPGYVFINIEMSVNMYYIINQIPKVYKILNNSCEFYSKINNAEIEPILRLIPENNIIDYSKVFMENSKIHVESGPLKGFEGLIKKIDKRKSRAKIALNFMGSEKLVELGIELITLADEKNKYK